MIVYRVIVKSVLPVLYVSGLVVLFPLFDHVFTESVTTIRMFVGQLGVEMGLIDDRRQMMQGIYRPELPYSFSRLDTLETKVGRRFDIVSFYQTWGDRSGDEFPIHLLQEIHDRGRIAMITWEPWLTEFARNRGKPADEVRTDLKAISEGLFDSFIHAWAKEAAIFGKPFFLRYAHEMNNQQYPWYTGGRNTAEDFVSAWRHVHDIFRTERASNVIWVWSPRGEMPRELFPGPEYVHWLGAAVFNYGAHGGDVWHSFEFLYEPVYKSALHYAKPIMIAELGCSPLGGSQAQWYADAFVRLRDRYHETAAIVFYNNPTDRTHPGEVIDWSIDENEEVIRHMRELFQVHE